MATTKRTTPRRSVEQRITDFFRRARRGRRWVVNSAGDIRAKRKPGDGTLGRCPLGAVPPRGVPLADWPACPTLVDVWDVVERHNHRISRWGNSKWPYWIDRRTMEKIMNAADMRADPNRDWLKRQLKIT